MLENSRFLRKIYMLLVIFRHIFKYFVFGECWFMENRTVYVRKTRENARKMNTLCVKFAILYEILRKKVVWFDFFYVKKAQKSKFGLSHIFYSRFLWRTSHLALAHWVRCLAYRKASTTREGSALPKTLLFQLLITIRDCAAALRTWP